MTAWRRIQRSQTHKVEPEKLIVFNEPDSTRILMLDGKHFSLHKHPHTLYVALDGVSGKPLLILLFPRYELKDGYDRILRYLKIKKCRIDAVVSDWHPGILASVHDYYPEATHQRCAAHVLQDVHRKLGGRRFLSTGLGKDIWPVMRKIALGYTHVAYARSYLVRMQNKFPEYHRAFRVLERALLDIYQFAKIPHAAIPRTSNRIENFMGILEQRLKTFRGMKTPKTLTKIIVSLIILKYKRPTKK